MPIPPPSLESIRPLPIIRGSVYCSCASSTCNLPSLVRARWAKISRINAVLSKILMPITLSILRCCAGESSSSKIHKSIFSCWAYKASSCTLPLPIKNAGSGLGRFCINFFITVAPAVSASCFNSSSESSTVHSESFLPHSMPIKMALSDITCKDAVPVCLSSMRSIVLTVLTKLMFSASSILYGP